MITEEELLELQIRSERLRKIEVAAGLLSETSGIKITFAFARGVVAITRGERD